MLDQWRFTQKHSYNWFKHGSSKAEDRHPNFNPAINEVDLLIATLDLRECAKLLSLEMTIYLAWAATEHPEFINDNGRRTLAPAIEMIEHMGSNSEVRFLRAAEHLRIYEDALRSGQIEPMSDRIGS
jgi:hypothetical protein